MLNAWPSMINRIMARAGCARQRAGIEALVEQGDWKALQGMASAQSIFQPDAGSEARMSKLVAAPDPAQRADFVGDDGLPYSWYPTVEGDGKWRVLHPGGVGRRLFELAQDAEASRIYLERMKTVGVKLPNGGWAWYYPRHIRISRLLGPDLKYSGMTAGDILGGYTEVLRRHPEAYQWCNPSDILESLYFPWQHGGVSLAGKAILELPLFRSPPELVLNGWLHALLFLNDYILVTQDARAQAFYEANVTFLAETLEDFHDRDTGLSRYSDLSPYKVRLACSEPEQQFLAWYGPKRSGLPELVYPLCPVDGKLGVSPYDNQLLTRESDGKAKSAMVSSSAKYTTAIVSTGPFKVTVDPGVTNYVSTVPLKSGRTLVVPAERIKGSGLYVASLQGVPLLSGTPTTFSKAGQKNYYHVQHVVALYYLAKFGRVNRAVRDAFVYYAERWQRTLTEFRPPAEYAFYDPDHVLRAMQGGKPLRMVEQFKELTS